MLNAQLSLVTPRKKNRHRSELFRDSLMEPGRC